MRRRPSTHVICSLVVGMRVTTRRLQLVLMLIKNQNPTETDQPRPV